LIVQINKSLKKLNTFGIDQKAERLIWAHSAEEILNYVRHHGAPALVLGGGRIGMISSYGRLTKGSVA